MGVLLFKGVWGVGMLKMADVSMNAFILKSPKRFLNVLTIGVLR
jgi:hypothetical protein